MHGKMISNDRSEHLPRPPWRNSLQRRWQAPRACRSRPQRRRSRPGKIVGVRFRVRTNFDHGLQSATACGTWRRSSPKAARPSTRSTCGSMIRGYGRWARQPNTDVIAQWVHRRRGTGRRADVLDPLASPSSPRRMGRAGASLRSPPDCRHPRRRDHRSKSTLRQPSLCPTWPPASTNCCDAIRRLGASNGQTSFPDAIGSWPSSSCAASLLKAPR